MKSQVQLTLILSFLCLITINCLSVTNERKRKAYITFNRVGYLRMVDVGSNYDRTWSCGTNGRVYKHAPSAADKVSRVHKHITDCARIDVSRNGKPWVVSRNGSIWRLDAVPRKINRFKWTKMPGCARDIGCGHKNTCFVIGCENTAHGGGIYMWSPTQMKWIKTGGGLATRVDAGTRHLYVVNKGGNFYRSSNGGKDWQSLPGQFIDVSVGANGSVYATSPKGTFQLVKNKFYQINPFGKSVSAGSYIWIVGVNNIAYRGRLNSKRNLSKGRPIASRRRGSVRNSSRIRNQGRNN